MDSHNYILIAVTFVTSAWVAVSIGRRMVRAWRLGPVPNVQLSQQWIAEHNARDIGE
jgi:hypothetical protein